MHGRSAIGQLEVKHDLQALVDVTFYLTMVQTGLCGCCEMVAGAGSGRSMQELADSMVEHKLHWHALDASKADFIQSVGDISYSVLPRTFYICKEKGHLPGEWRFPASWLLR